MTTATTAPYRTVAVRLGSPLRFIVRDLYADGTYTDRQVGSAQAMYRATQGRS